MWASRDCRKVNKPRLDKIIKKTSSYPAYYIPDTTNYGFMALQRRPNHLECHYCGRRSDIRHDGSVMQWECKVCEAMNYLDENGEVADPPTSDTSGYERQSSNQIQYAQAPRRPGPARPLPTPEQPLFCSDCLRNQQLFTTSLAQYLPDDSDPDYEVLYKNYYKFRRNLEKRYPQICTDCEPRVTARMEQAGYKAKTDCLRRLLDKSKKSRIPGPSYKFSWASLFSFLGLLLWSSGLLIQILWNILGCFGSQTATTLASFVPQSQFLVVIPYLKTTWAVPPAVLHFCSLMLPYLYSANGAPTSAKNGLIMSTISIWWNPEYKNSIRGFNEHISGYQDWYKMQVLSIMFRFFFWIFMRRSWFGDADTVVVKAAHSFMLILTLITSFIAYNSMTVDHSRIFVHTSEKLKRFVQEKPKPIPSETAASQLFARQNSTPRPRVPLFPQNISSAPIKRNIDFNVRPPKLDSFIKDLNSKKYSGSSQKIPFKPDLSRSRTPSFDGSQSSPQAINDHHQLTAFENLLQPKFSKLAVRASTPTQSPSPVQYQIPTQNRPPTQTPLYPNRNQAQQSPPSASDMDWESSRPARALQLDPSTLNRTGFETTPVVPAGNKGAFWYRVPAAPRSQNAKLRNPITPGFCSTSTEQKENFFQSISGRKTSFTLGGDNKNNNNDAQTPRYEMNMADPKFFPPEPTKYADDGLSELMSQSFSLEEKVENEVKAEEEEKGRRWWHLLFVLVVISIVGFYVYLTTPSYEALYQEILALSHRSSGFSGSPSGGMSFEDGRKWDSDYR